MNIMGISPARINENSVMANLIRIRPSFCFSFPILILQVGTLSDTLLA
jgi:hypothetical protein